MALTTRITPMDHQIDLVISRALSKEARAAKLAAFARDKLAEAQTAHQAAGGLVPPHETIVDQRRGAVVESVRAEGEIVFEFELLTAAVLGILDMLQKASPVLTGDYRRAHAIFADGVEVAPGALPAATSEFVILSTSQYARPIERGISKAAPDGVYQVTAVLAARRYGNVARIRFSYRSAVGGRALAARANRAPAIIITPR